MTAVSTPIALFDDPDQDKVVADLTTFFGPRSKRFLDLYEKMRQRPAKKRSNVLSWNWAAFFAPFVWFFYRKQYIWGAAALLAPIVISMLFGNIGGGAYIVFPMFANNWYVQSALRRIAKANKLGLVGEERADYLRRAGGISKVSGSIAALFFLILMALAFLAVMNAAGPAS